MAWFDRLGVAHGLVSLNVGGGASGSPAALVFPINDATGSGKSAIAIDGSMTAFIVVFSCSRPGRNPIARKPTMPATLLLLWTAIVILFVHSEGVLIATGIAIGIGGIAQLAGLWRPFR